MIHFDNAYDYNSVFSFIDLDLSVCVSRNVGSFVGSWRS